MTPTEQIIVLVTLASIHLALVLCVRWGRPRTVRDRGGRAS